MPRTCNDVETYAFEDCLWQLVVVLKLPISVMSGGDEAILLVPMPLQL